ncbi:glycine cleavage system aminomethyltransferase GcvT [soil metagenome]
MDLKKVALNDIHLEAGAKMVPFAGYNMPVRYTSDIEEHNTVRKGAGIFDVSHMGEFSLKGPGALDLIQRVVSNDASKLEPGQAQYAYLPNETGGIVDDLLIYRLGEEDYMLVVNASNIEKDWNWISKFNSGSVDMRNISEETALFAVQGPLAVEAIQELTMIDLAGMKNYTFKKGTFAGIDDVIVSATGYTGAGGFEIYLPNHHAVHVWKEIIRAGAPVGIKPIGLGARDTLRLEMGYNLYGNDITDHTCPLEAGLGWVTKFNKSFTNSENLQKKKEAGATRKLVGFVLSERGIPRAHYDIYNEQGQKIGEVTSGSQSPSLNQGIGLGYVEKAYSQPDSEILIGIRNKMARAKIVKLPFVKKD